ncbi:hypothetical protein PF004_g22889 [Phytophthora fragariae]|uniref:Uncharacterized protein n=2 Tax=Phytophthora fragariae TaxID=53985 RepID=A0A6A3DXE3_9STRA|nr:hypothetical protein PF009_g24959 [Phytophthora fragariae]KAE9187127.1 hypothetical protein PF004_g22889 [Phytophthora fragariae]
MSSIPPRSFAAVLFVPEEGDYFQCRLFFLRRKQARGTGREGSPDAFVKADEFARTVNKWLDWIMENRELSMCEKPKTRKYTHLAHLRGNTLKKHMFGLEDVVRRIVKQRISGQKLGFAVDVWTEDGNHFIAIIAIT